MKKQLFAALGSAVIGLSSMASMAIACADGSAVPRPNQQGDFTPRNSNIWKSETNGLVTWPRWRVVSRDGELNCRTVPNGRITRVYLTGRDRVDAELRGASAIQFSNGSPWLLTRDRCYVRANVQYIQPI